MEAYTAMHMDCQILGQQCVQIYMISASYIATRSITYKFRVLILNQKACS